MPDASQRLCADAVLCTTFAPCGAYLVCGTAFGRVHVFELDAHAEPLAPPAHRASFCAHKLACASLAFATVAGVTVLLSGGDEEIRGWKWDEVLTNPAGGPRVALSLQNPRVALHRGATQAPLLHTVAAPDETTRLPHTAMPLSGTALVLLDTVRHGQARLGTA